MTHLQWMILILFLWIMPWVVLKLYAPSAVAMHFRTFFFKLQFQNVFRHLFAGFSPTAHTLATYQNAITRMMAADAMRKKFELSVEKHGQRMQEVAYETYEYGILEREHARAVKAAAKKLGKLSDKQLHIISAALCAESFGDLLPSDALLDFLKDERETIRLAPHQALGHWKRTLTRLSEMQKGLLEAMKQLQPALADLAEALKKLAPPDEK